MAQYCIGPVMATDWGEGDSPPKLERALLRRVFGYFVPYRRRGAGALLSILAQSVLGLAPALVFKTLIDYLASRIPASGTSRSWSPRVSRRRWRAG